MLKQLFDVALPYLLGGIAVGGQYALIAIGYTMVYGILRLINFAHGDIFMVAGLIMVYSNTAITPILISCGIAASKCVYYLDYPLGDNCTRAYCRSRSCG